MEKKYLIKETVKLLEQCEDVELMHLIWLLLLKSGQETGVDVV